MKKTNMIVAMITMIALTTLAMGASQPSAITLDGSSNIVFSVSITNGTCHLGDRIEITVTYSNWSNVAVEVDEGSLRAQFSNMKEGGMFNQLGRTSYASGVKTVILKPGEVYKDILILEPRSNIQVGKYKAKILSHLRWRSKQSIEAGEVVFEIN